MEGTEGVVGVEGSLTAGASAGLELEEGSDRYKVCGDIFLYCDANVEERGKPVAVLAVDEIPLTGMGKNDYRTLEKKYANYDYTQWSVD